VLLPRSIPKALPLILITVFAAQLCLGQSAQKNSPKILIEYFRNWTDDDVPWIITPEERASFHLLRNDNERNAFIKQFWQRRDPIPTTGKNEFQDQYYRRVLAANEKFSTSSRPGWRTDRGRIYILYGPPDSVDSGAKDLPRGAVAKTESWHYKYLEGIGSDVVLDFADRTANDDYKLELPDNLDEKIVTAPPVPAGSKNSEIAKALREHPGQPVAFVGLNSPPPIRFKELEEVVNHRIKYTLFPLNAAYTVKKATTNVSVATVNVTILSQDSPKHPFGAGEVHAFVRVVDMAGRFVATDEQSIEDPRMTGASQISAQIPLFPGRYRADIVVHDVATDSKSTISLVVNIPERTD
jgi:GWxTD domain-containing protein